MFSPTKNRQAAKNSFRGNGAYYPGEIEYAPSKIVAPIGWDKNKGNISAPLLTNALEINFIRGTMSIVPGMIEASGSPER